MIRNETDRIRRAVRRFDALLALFPRDFRRAYEDEMRHVFVESYRRLPAEGRSWRARARFWTSTVWGMVLNAIGVRLDARRGASLESASTGTGSAMLRRLAPLRDLGSGLGMLRRSPGFASLIVLVLGLGIGTATTVVAVVHTTLLEPLPYPEPDRVVIVWGSATANGQMRDVVSGPVALDLEDRNSSFAALAAIKPDGAVLIRDDRPQVLKALNVTTDFFDVLEVEPWLGRWFAEREGYSGGEAVTVVSHAFWREALGADSGAVGTRVLLDGSPYTVVGVLEPDFYFPSAPDVIVPLRKDVLRSYDRTYYDYWMVGRLREGTSIAAAGDDLNRILRDIARDDPRLSNWSILIEPLHESVVQFVRPALLVLLVGVGFVWLISVVNVANLLLIRLSNRHHGIAVRRALGASDSRLAAFLLGESAGLTVLGLTVGIGLATIALALLRVVTPPAVPIPGSAAQVMLVSPTLGGWAVGLALVMSGIGMALFSIPVLWNGLRGDGSGLLGNAVRTQTPARRMLRTHNTLVAVELTTATLLLVGAGLAARTTVNLMHVDSGMAHEGVLTMYVGDLNGRSNEDRVRFFDRVLREVADVPGVAIVGLNDYVPLQSEDDFEGVRFPNRPPPPPGEGPREEWRRVSADYFSAAGISVLRGREFAPGDDAGAPSVAVVNRAFAARYYGSEDPVGRTISVTNDEYALTEIVGVVEDVRRRGLDRDAPPVLYVPYQRRPRSNMALFVRTSGDPTAIVEPVKAAIWRVDPGQPIDRVATLDEVVRSSIGVPRLMMQVIGVLASVALALAAIGVFGVTAYSVRLRHREIGIRVALGANPRAVRSMVLGRSVVTTVLSLVAGFALALLLGRWMEGLLYGVKLTDPTTVIGVVALLGIVSLVAASVPARRATRIDPVESLRAD